MKLRFKPVPIPENTSTEDWNSWFWQSRRSLKNEQDYERIFKLSDEERQGFQIKHFKVQTTPYYAQLAADEPPGGPLRRILMPHICEKLTGHQALLDPLGEKNNHPAPRIIHRYSDRALFLVTDNCNVYCRYCTRKHFTGKEQAFASKDEYEQSLNYLRQTPKIREVILSGGDPLTLSNKKLDSILSDLRQIEHIEIIRIGSRMPVVNPMRIDYELINTLKKHQPIYMMLHFNHPKELTAEAAEALTQLADGGLPLFNQMVLLNGINNHEAIVQALSRRLMYLRVKPYYMFQCDPSEGTDHLRTSLQESEKIQKNLWGHLSGLAMPNLIVDIPDGGGKVGVVPHFEKVVAKNNLENERHYCGWDGKEGVYINPPPEQHTLPMDYENYLGEWHSLIT